jgi:catechol 2,3-dioxygenase
MTVAHLAHLELLTDKFDESLDFFVRVYGLTETLREGNSAYLRAWDDYEHHTLKLTAAQTTGVGHIAYRTSSAQALEQQVAIIENAGYGLGWSDGDAGHGPAYQFRSPDGHLFEIYWESVRYDPPEAERPALKNTAQRFHGRGCAVRRIDHLNLMAQDLPALRDFMVTCLGSKVTEQLVLDDGTLAACWFTVNNKGYDLACTVDHSGMTGRFHHVAYAADQRDDILRAADIYLENGVFIESGPHRHAIQGTFFLYAYEPAGNRIEIANAGARLVLDPDWQTVTWTEADRKKGQAWGMKTVDTFHSYGTPPASD